MLVLDILTRLPRVKEKQPKAYVIFNEHHRIEDIRIIYFKQVHKLASL